jgi:hypothetical protein
VATPLTPSEVPKDGWKSDEAVHKLFPDIYEKDMASHLPALAKLSADLAGAGTHVRKGVAVTQEELGAGVNGDFEPSTGTVRLVIHRARLIGALMDGLLDYNPKHWAEAMEALITGVHEVSHGNGNENPTIFAQEYNSWDDPLDSSRYVPGARAFREGMNELWAITKAKEIAERSGRPPELAATPVQAVSNPQFVAAMEVLLASAAAPGTDGTEELREVISRNASRDSMDILVQKLFHKSGLPLPNDGQRGQVIDAILEPLGRLETAFSDKPLGYEELVAAGYCGGNDAMRSAMQVIQEIRVEGSPPRARPLPLEKNALE